MEILTLNDLNRLNIKIRSKFAIDIGSRIKDKNRDMIITKQVYKKYLNNKITKSYLYHCNICGFNEGIISESELIRGCRCSCCLGRTVVKGINDITTTAPWMIKYFCGGIKEAEKYTCKSGMRIKPICPYCNHIYDKNIRIIDIYKNRGFGCNCSSDHISYPEKVILSMLKSCNIKFIYQLTNNNMQWAKKYKYDFFLQDYSTIIEVNGGQHYSNSMFTITLEEQKNNDKIKKEIAIKNKIKHYICLDCSKSNIEYIRESVINSGLLDIIETNKDNINWVACDKYAQSNLVYDVCKYYMKHKNMPAYQIADVFGIHHSTACRYLNKGKEFGWCDYISGNKKPIEVSKSGSVVWVFESAKDAEEKYPNIFKKASLSHACNGVNTIKKYIYKGYNVRYI